MPSGDVSFEYELVEKKFPFDNNNRIQITSFSNLCRGSFILARFLFYLNFVKTLNLVSLLKNSRYYVVTDQWDSAMKNEYSI